jgi:anti-anti-sigma factor
MDGNQIFHITEIVERDICVMKITGELRFEHRTQFKTASKSLLTSDRSKIVIDLSNAKRVFSMFLGSMVDLQQSLKEHGKTMAILCSPRVMKLFEQANLDKLLTLIEAQK